MYQVQGRLSAGGEAEVMFDPGFIYRETVAGINQLIADLQAGGSPGQRGSLPYRCGSVRPI
jgi:hypothetical protein